MKSIAEVAKEFSYKPTIVDADEKRYEWDGFVIREGAGGWEHWADGGVIKSGKNGAELDEYLENFHGERG